MRRLLPAPAGEVDARSAYRLEDREVPEGRPYVVVNMVESVDGSTAVGGVTRPLGSRTDRRVFHHLRAGADAILVGASTARAERYGPVELDAETRAARRAQGRRPCPPIVVVTRSAELDWSSPLFQAAESPTIVLLPSDVEPAAMAAAARSADVVALGRGSVDLRAALGELRARGIRLLLCEGGPTLNGELSRQGLVDELCVTVAPLLSAGATPRGLLGPGPGGALVDLELAHALEDGGFLYLRYVAGAAR